MKYAMLKVFRRFGFDLQRYGPHRDPMRRFQCALARHNADTVLDVGADTGQFGQRLRINGYEGRIVSFEPRSDAHARLTAVTKDDPSWTVVARCAVGATCGMGEINIAANSQSSSVLPMLDRHLEGDPNSGFVGKEPVELITLDAFFEKNPHLATPAMGMKVDTQGYESEVLAGLVQLAGRIKIIQIEMPLAPLYEGSAGFIELYHLMRDRGYECISVEPNFIDPRTYKVLETDAIFELRDH